MTPMSETADPDPQHSVAPQTTAGQSGMARSGNNDVPLTRTDVECRGWLAATSQALHLARKSNDTWLKEKIGEIHLYLATFPTAARNYADFAKVHDVLEKIALGQIGDPMQTARDVLIAIGSWENAGIPSADPRAEKIKQVLREDGYDVAKAPDGRWYWADEQDREIIDRGAFDTAVLAWHDLALAREHVLADAGIPVDQVYFSDESTVVLHDGSTVKHGDFAQHKVFGEVTVQHSEELGWYYLRAGHASFDIDLQNLSAGSQSPQCDEDESANSTPRM